MPHPDWRFIPSARDLPTRPWTDAAHGWTVRCCPVDRYEFGLPSRHYLPFAQVGAVVTELGGSEDRLVFVVYPSWRFDVSGCCLLDGSRLRVEVIQGNIAPLLRGEKNPDGVWASDGPAYLCLHRERGAGDLVSGADRRVLLECARIVEVRTFTVIEWTRTAENELLFHDLLEA